MQNQTGPDGYPLCQCGCPRREHALGNARPLSKHDAIKKGRSVGQGYAKAFCYGCLCMSYHSTHAEPKNLAYKLRASGMRLRRKGPEWRETGDALIKQGNLILKQKRDKNALPTNTKATKEFR